VYCWQLCTRQSVCTYSCTRRVSAPNTPVLSPVSWLKLRPLAVNTVSAGNRPQASPHAHSQVPKVCQPLEDRNAQADELIVVQEPASRCQHLRPRFSCNLYVQLLQTAHSFEDTDVQCCQLIPLQDPGSINPSTHPIVTFLPFEQHSQPLEHWQTVRHSETHSCQLVVP
jgi:hypothetical protein